VTSSALRSSYPRERASSIHLIHIMEILVYQVLEHNLLFKILKLKKIYKIFLSVNNSIMWDITTCSPLKVTRHFVGTCSLHLHGRKIIETRNLLCFATRFILASYLLIIWPWRWRRNISPNRLLAFNGLHGFISQSIRLHNHRCEDLGSYISHCFSWV
jgi:hypothetical protein